MRTYTAHLRTGTAPVLVKEGFACGALLFGGLWLLAWRAWVEGVLALSAAVLVAALVPGPARTVLESGLAVALGLCGRDVVRTSLARRGYALGHVVAASDGDAALLRLLDACPELAAGFLPGATTGPVGAGPVGAGPLEAAR